jgi:HK97 family phage prohead protease
MGAKAKPGSAIFTLGGSLMHEREPDFTGYVTRANMRCSDGRTIMPDAFKHQDKTTVPLVWHHGHDDANNVLGHTVLENREDGVYGYGFFNPTPQGKNAHTLVQHDDIKFLSIYANKLVEKASSVVHGMIREVSLVMAGANPGAFIDNVRLEHSDGERVTLEDEAIISTGLAIAHADSSSSKPDDKGGSDKTVQEIYDAMSEEQQTVVHYMVGAAVEAAGSAEHSDKSIDEKKKEGTWMARNVFEQKEKEKNGGGDGKPERRHLSHDEFKEIHELSLQHGTLKQGVEAYALKHGIDNIEILFPDAKAVDAVPDLDKRRTEWVSGVLNGTKHSPFTRIKNFWADLTQDEARAKGYIKGSMKKEEWFGVSKRTTGPATAYKKQKLDRDDILDITDFDVVAFLKGEMRIMLDEELAVSILIGDGREVDDPDKIKDPIGATDGTGIRSIINDHELYAATINVNIDDANSKPEEIVEAVMYGMELYKGSGAPTFYTTLKNQTWLLLAKDNMGRRFWNTPQELANAMGVRNIVAVEPMDRVPDVFGIIVNLSDYTIGTDKGGDVTLFDDFNIDYNQYTYLLETRLSGALTKIRSALVVRKTAAANVLVAPEEPDFDGTTITPKTTAGVTYKRADTNAVVTTAAPIALADGDSLKIYATPNAGKYFADDQHDEWTFKNEAG